MKYNHVSVYQVIAKVMKDLDITEENQRINDYIDWAGEAIELIGAPVQMETVTTEDDPIEVKGYQAHAPFDSQHIMIVEYSPVKDGLYKRIHQATSIKDVSALKRDANIYYSIKPKYIVLNVKDGYIKVTYKRLFKDVDGMIMVPDLMSYLEAIYWYIDMKITYPLWRIGKIRDSVYLNSKNSWNFFKNKAYGEMMMPTYDQYANGVKNAYNRIIPEMNEDSNALKNIGVQEKVRFE